MGQEFLHDTFSERINVAITVLPIHSPYFTPLVQNAAPAPRGWVEIKREFA